MHELALRTEVGIGAEGEHEPVVRQLEAVGERHDATGGARRGTFAVCLRRRHGLHLALDVADLEHRRK